MFPADVPVTSTSNALPTERGQYNRSGTGTGASSLWEGRAPILCGKRWSSDSRHSLWKLVLLWWSRQSTGPNNQKVVLLYYGLKIKDAVKHSIYLQAQQAFLSLWWTYGRTFSTSRTRTFRSRAGWVQYQIGSSLALFVNTLSANNTIWVRSLCRIIKELDLEQFIHWSGSTKQQQ